MSKYFYRWEGLRFSFYRIPKALYTDPRYRGMDALAKQLYGLFLDRLDLSLKNGWFDEDGRVYIIYTLKEAMDALGCANQKATKLFSELEKYGLIERKHQGLCKPNLIYVLDFLDRSEDGNAGEDFLSTHVRNHGNHKESILILSILIRMILILSYPDGIRMGLSKDNPVKTISEKYWRSIF